MPRKRHLFAVQVDLGVFCAFNEPRIWSCQLPSKLGQLDLAVAPHEERQSSAGPYSNQPHSINKNDYYVKPIRLMRLVRTISESPTSHPSDGDARAERSRHPSDGTPRPAPCPKAIRRAAPERSPGCRRQAEWIEEGPQPQDSEALGALDRSSSSPPVPSRSAI